MSKRPQRVFSVLLAALMCVGMLPFVGVGSYAATDGYYTYTVDSNSKATIILVESDISGDVVIPQTLGGATVVGINSSAFDVCKNVTSIYIPAQIQAIGSTAFYNCEKLGRISVDAANAYFSSDSDGVLYNKAKTKLLRFPMGSAKTSFNIPETVTNIGSYSFYSSKKLESVVIPTSVRTIEKNAFYKCSGLLSVNIPRPVSSIGYEAFSGCDGLRSVTVDSYNQSFSSDENGVLYNKNKTELKLFPASSDVTSYTVPASVTSIESSAFYANKKLETVTFAPGSFLRVINKQAFANCKSLKAVVFAQDGDIETIGISAFENCTALETFSAPASVIEILQSAFAGCSKLKTLYIYNSSCLLGAGMCPSSGVTIHGYANSTAQKYAQENRLAFVSLNGGGSSGEEPTSGGGSSGDGDGDTDSPINIGSIFARIIEFFKTLFSYIIGLFGA